MVGVPPRTFPLLPDEVYGRLPPVPRLEHAACRKAGVDPEWFFPGRGGRIELARAICQNCPDLEQCRRWALSLPDWQSGVIAGLSQHERRLARRSSNGPENEGGLTMTTTTEQLPADLAPFDEMDAPAEEEYRRWCRARFTPAGVEEAVVAERLRRAEAAKWQAEHDLALNENILNLLRTEFSCIACSTETEGRWSWRGRPVALCARCGVIMRRRQDAAAALASGKTREQLVDRLIDEFPELIET
jgi:WhiB family redox-sensing transcriptional regulator